MMKSLLLVSAALLCAYPALADDMPAPDKSGYTLFKSTPTDQMRSFSTDRPTKSDTPYTVDAGHYQYESDALNWAYNHHQTTTSNLLIADPTLKVGLTNRTDLELALTPINVNYSHVRGTNSKDTAAGFGDVYTRLKYNIFGNDSGDYALAVVPYVKAPTAAHNVGNNHWEGGGYVPFIAAMPYDWMLNITNELDIYENAALNGHHVNYSGLINFSHSVFDDSLTGYVEFWSDVNNDANTVTQYTADFALSWIVKDNLQLDAGINVGLNKAANDLQPYVGISQRF